MQKINKVVRIGLAGGLIGAMVTNTKSTFEKALIEANAEGWNLAEVIPLSGTNLFMLFLRVFLLIITLGLFTLGSNYFLIFEKPR